MPKPLFRFDPPMPEDEEEEGEANLVKAGKAILQVQPPLIHHPSGRVQALTTREAHACMQDAHGADAYADFCRRFQEQFPAKPACSIKEGFDCIPYKCLTQAQIKQRKKEVVERVTQEALEEIRKRDKKDKAKEAELRKMLQEKKQKQKQKQGTKRKHAD